MNREIGSRPGMGDREGPLTEYQAAAVAYRDVLGVPTFADARSVWLVVPADRAAISVAASLATAVADALHASGVDAPVIIRPDGHKIFLCRCDPIACPRSAPSAGEVIVHLGYQCMVDLPPTPFPSGQAVTRLAWLHAPELDATWPSCGEVLDVIARCIDQ